MSASVRSVAVLGTGTMGQGIAQLCASAGIETRLYDVSVPQLERALAAIGEQLKKLVVKGRLADAELAATLNRLHRTSELELACRDVELVIEAAPESMELKVELLTRVEQLIGQKTLIASNTSSLSVTELGRRIGAAERTLGLHFFNPPPVMPLLEIVRGLGTSDESIERALGFAPAIKKEPIVVRD